MANRIGVGVYEDGRVDVSGEDTYFETDIERWREANKKVEELAKLAGV